MDVRETAKRAVKRVPGVERAAPSWRRRVLRLRIVRWGSLRRKRPFTSDYGYSRGTPIDRVFIDQFLRRHAVDIGGAALEVKDDRLTHRHGGARITSVDVVDIDASNPCATILADLSESGSLPAARFDCFVCTQTLQYVPDPDAALRNMWQALRPGGVLLITAPTVTRVDPSLRRVDRWRFTPAGLSHVLTRACRGADPQVEAFGGLTASLAFLAGLCAEDLRAHELASHDPDHALLVCGRAAKPS